MGWITEYEQQQILTLYGVIAQHRCNKCGQPIFIHELFVQDPKGGYYPKDKNMPDFLPAHPRLTYHRRCNDLKHGKEPKDYSPEALARTAKKLQGEKDSRKIQKQILDLLTRNPRKRYWTKTLVAQDLWKRHKTKRLATKREIRVMVEDGILRRDDIYLRIPKDKK